MKKLAIILTGLLLLAATAAMAEVPKTINYQARLTDLSGNPIPDGTPSVTFRLYESATAAIAEAKWTDTFDVHTKNGFFNILLGSGSVPFPGTLDFSKQYWVGIKVGSDDEMTARLPLASVPYAMRAEIANTATAIADNCVTSAKIAANAVVTGKIADGAVSTQAKAPWAPTVNTSGSILANPKIKCGTGNASCQITFPAAFTTGCVPTVVIGALGVSGGHLRAVSVESISATGFFARGFQDGAEFTEQIGFNWMAIGY